MDAPMATGGTTPAPDADPAQQERAMSAFREQLAAARATAEPRQRADALRGALGAALGVRPDPLPALALFLDAVLGSSGSGSGDGGGGAPASSQYEGGSQQHETTTTTCLPLAAARPLLGAYAAELASGRLSALPQQHAAALRLAIERAQPRAASFEEQLAALRTDLAAVLERQEDWRGAAQALAGVDLGGGGGARGAGDGGDGGGGGGAGNGGGGGAAANSAADWRHRLRTNVRIAMLYLEDDDPVSAETYVKRAAQVLAGPSPTAAAAAAAADASAAAAAASALADRRADAGLALQYKSCCARIADAKRRFLDAALRYYELSTAAASPQLAALAAADPSAPPLVGEDDALAALRQAVTCALLAAAGPQRSRVLATLYKDERTPRLPEGPLLEKVYLDRILRTDEVEAFAQTLRPHQLATLPGGQGTVLSRAVLQHNLRAASRVYTRVRLSALARAVLGAAVGGGASGAAAVEEAVADMISEGRLAASIDHGALLGEEDDDDAVVTFGAAAPAARRAAKLAREGQGGTSGAAAVAAAAAAEAEGATGVVEPLAAWDAQVSALCDELSGALEAAAAAGLVAVGAVQAGAAGGGRGAAGGNGGAGPSGVAAMG